MSFFFFLFLQIAGKRIRDEFTKIYSFYLKNRERFEAIFSKLKKEYDEIEKTNYSNEKELRIKLLQTMFKREHLVSFDF